jgi:hypothetical protein
MTLRPAKALAAQLQVSERSYRQALAQLRDDPDCPIAFHSEARRDATAPSRRGKCVRIALKSWLRYDGLPRLYKKPSVEEGSMGLAEQAAVDWAALRATVAQASLKR